MTIIIQFNLYLVIIFALAITSCTGSSIVNLSSSGTTTSTTASPSTTPVGARAIKIIFNQSTGGSFDAPPTGGTPNVPGSGLQAMRVFNADGSTLASGGPNNNANWPAWLSSFELGVSGATNSASGNPYCANFASNTESTSNTCNIALSGGGTLTNCGAPTGMFRVSEADCTLGSPVSLAGNGGPNDGVYFRATFNRNSAYLASTENILVVLEYFASAVNPAPANPSTCFTSGRFTPEACTDFVWKAFIKHTTTEVVQPYLLLVPPTFSSILTAGTTGPQSTGTGLAAKQFFIPLAGDQNLTVLQISRIGSNFPGTPSTPGTAAYNLNRYCTGANAVPGLSPLCAGMMFYSITFYRI